MALLLSLSKIFSVAATLLAFIFYLPIMLAPKAIRSMFIATPSVVVQGAGDFRLFFVSYIVLGFWIVILTLMQSLGRASKASVLVILRQIALYIPAAIIMPHVAVLGVFTAPLITDVIVLAVAVWMIVSEFKRMDTMKIQGR